MEPAVGAGCCAGCAGTPYALNVKRVGFVAEKIEPELLHAIRCECGMQNFVGTSTGSAIKWPLGDPRCLAIRRQIAAALEEARAEQHHDDCRLCLSGNTTAAVLGMVPCYVEVNLRKSAAKLRKGE